MAKRLPSQKRYPERKRKEHSSERPMRERERCLRYGPLNWLQEELDRQAHSDVYLRGKRLGSRLRRAVHERDSGCVCCGYNSNPEHMTVHHIFPRRFGGTDHTGNLRSLCTECHKHFNHLEYQGWRWWRFFEYVELSKQDLEQERQENGLPTTHYDD